MEQQSRTVEPLQQVAVVGRRVGRVEWYPGESSTPDAEDGDHRRRSVRRKHCDLRIGAQTRGAQASGNPTGQLSCLPVAPLLCVGDIGGTIRVDPPTAVEEVDDGHGGYRSRIVTAAVASSPWKKPPPFSATAMRAMSTCRGPASPRSWVTSS